MNPDQLQQMMQWLNQQISHLDDSIIEAQQANNCGRETQYEGMREAFMKCLNKIGKD
jgi:hypothetical protein